MSLLKPTLQNHPVGIACLFAFTLMWNGFILVFGITMLSAGVGPQLLCLLPFVTVGVLLLAGCGWVIWSGISKGLNLDKPEVVVSTSRLRVGEAFSFTYRQRFKRAVTTNGVTIQLLLRETAIYRRGTDTHTDTHDKVIQEFQHFGKRYESGEAFYDQRTLQIPPNGMHTFAAQRNKVQWFVKTELKLAGWPDVTELYELTVVPERML